MPTPPMNRNAVLPEGAYAPLREALPGTQPERATWIGSGWGAIAFRVPAEDGDWVVRIPSGVSWAIEDLEREVRTLPLLEQRPFEVETPRGARVVRDANGAFVAAVHRLVPGTSSKGLTLRGRARADHLAAIGRFLATLHTTPAGDARRHGIEERDVWTEVSLPRIEETMALVGPKTRAWLEDRVRMFETLDRSDVPAALIHGDLSGDHLLADDEGRLTGVIDFAEARLSDPALDFAGVLNRWSWRDLAVVLAHYDAPIDATLLDRARVYIEIVPIYSVTDGYVAAGEAERTAGLRKLSARAAAWDREVQRGNRGR